MAVKSNTERILSHVRRTTIHTWTLGGAIAAAAANISVLIDTEADQTTRIGMAVISLIVLVIAVILGIVIAVIKAGRLKKIIEVQTASAKMPFDADELHPLTAEKNLLLGKDWLVINTGAAAMPFAKASIASADSLVNRKEGMQKLWVNITGKDGKQYPCMYKAAENDALEAVQNWLNGPVKTVKAAASPLPAEQRTFAVNEGDCPFCTGPNEAGASVCRWCGKDLTAPAPVRASFAEPAQAKPVIVPISAPLSVPEERKQTGKTVYIVIAALLIVLAVLLYMMFR